MKNEIGLALNKNEKMLVAIGGAAAIALTLLLVLDAIRLAATSLFPAAGGGWLSGPRENWILLFLQLNAGLNGVLESSLHGVYPLDIAIMILAGIFYSAQLPLLRKNERIWWILSGPFQILGIITMFATGTAGRTGVPTGGLIMAILMLLNRRYTGRSAILGIVANGAIVATIEIASMLTLSPITAVLIGIAYVSWIAWLVSVGVQSVRMAAGPRDE